MDSTTLVSEGVESGEDFLARMAADAIEIHFAGWVKEGEQDQWILYIASPSLDSTSGTEEANIRVQALAREAIPPLSVFSLRYVHVNHPFVREMIAVRNARRGRGGWYTRPGNLVTLGSEYERAYIYPAVVPAVANPA